MALNRRWRKKLVTIAPKIKSQLLKPGPDCSVSSSCKPHLTRLPPSFKVQGPPLCCRALSTTEPLLASGCSSAWKTVFFSSAGFSSTTSMLAPQSPLQRDLSQLFSLSSLHVLLSQTLPQSIGILISFFLSLFLFLSASLSSQMSDF